MSMDHERKMLVGQNVREFIEGGGELRYQPVRTDGKTHWYVFGVRPDGSEIPVLVSNKGVQKRIRSADAVVSYHQGMFPKSTEITIPVIPLHESSNGDDWNDERE